MPVPCGLFTLLVLTVQVVDQAIAFLRDAQRKQESDPAVPPSSHRVSTALSRSLTCLLSAQPDLLGSKFGPEERSVALDTCHSAIAALSRVVAEETQRRAEVQSEYSAACTAIQRCAEAVAGAQAAVAASPTSRWRSVNDALSVAQRVVAEALEGIEASRTSAFAAPLTDGQRNFDGAVRAAQKSLKDCTKTIESAMRSSAELREVLARWSADIEQSAGVLCGVVRTSLAIDALYASATPAPEAERSSNPGDILLRLLAPMPPVNDAAFSLVDPEPPLAEQLPVANAALDAAVSPPLVRVSLRDAFAAVLAGRLEVFSAMADPAAAASTLFNLSIKLQACAASAASAVAEARAQGQQFASEHGARPGAMTATAVVIDAAAANLARHEAAAEDMDVTGAAAVNNALTSARQALQEASATYATAPQSAAAAAAQTVLAAEAARRATAAVAAVADAVSGEVSRRRDASGTRDALKV